LLRVYVPRTKDGIVSYIGSAMKELVIE